MSYRVLDLVDEVRGLLLSAPIRRDASPYGHLLRAECEAILEDAGEDLGHDLPDKDATLCDLEFARDALREHLDDLRGPFLSN